MRKAERHEAIRERAAEALLDLYHNATPAYPVVPEHLCRHFEYWLSDAASQEIDYIRNGGAYGKDYRKTLEAPCNAGRYTSTAAQTHYVRKGMRAMREERSRCNRLDSREHLVNALWERISEYGKLYQWGRGGRTLAPDGLIKQSGGSSFRIDEDYASEQSITDTVELIQIVESFNRYVKSWCKSVPEQWADYLAENPIEEECAA